MLINQRFAKATAKLFAGCTNVFAVNEREGVALYGVVARQGVRVLYRQRQLGGPDCTAIPTSALAESVDLSLFPEARPQEVPQIVGTTQFTASGITTLKVARDRTPVATITPYVSTYLKVDDRYVVCSTATDGATVRLPRVAFQLCSGMRIAVAANVGGYLMESPTISVWGVTK